MFRNPCPHTRTHTPMPTHAHDQCTRAQTPLCACRSPSITHDLPCVSRSCNCCAIPRCSSLDLSDNALSAASVSILWHTWPAIDVSGNTLAGPMPTPVPGVVPVTTHLNVSFNNYTGALPIATIVSLPQALHGAVFDLSCNYFDLGYAYKLQLYCDRQGDTCLYQTQFPNTTCVARNSGVPTAPTGVLVAPSVLSVIVAWDPKRPGKPIVTSFTILAYTTATGMVAAPVANATCAYPCTNVTVPGLTPGVAYVFTVAAVGPGGSSAPSVPSSAVTPCAAADQVPDAPRGVTPTCGVGSVHVTWLSALPSPCWAGPILAWNVTVIGSMQGSRDVGQWVVLPASNLSWTLAPVTRASGYAYSFQVRGSSRAASSIPCLSFPPPPVARRVISPPLSVFVFNLSSLPPTHPPHTPLWRPPLFTLAP
jgi:hypothetical protein